MTWQWVSANLLTGQDIADLPGFDAQYPLTQSLSRAETATGVMHLDKNTPENWQEALYPGGSVLACYDDTDPTSAILWAGVITSIGPTSVTSNDVPVSMVTLEGWLDRNFVGDVTYTTAQAANDIVASMVNTYFTAVSGVGLQLSYTAGLGGKPTSPLVLQNSDNAGVQTRIDQIFGQLGGEYTIQWSWSNNGQSLTPTLIFGPRIGQAVAAGGYPLVTFEAPGLLTDFQWTWDYSEGVGANRIVAYSSGEGSATPYAQPVNVPQAGRPVIEHRYSPGPSLSPDALTQYAQQAAAILAPGGQAISLTVSTQNPTGCRFGTDWRLGDDIGYRITSPYLNENGNWSTIRAFPRGMSGVGRCIGVQINEATITPVLADKTVYVQPQSVGS